MHLLHTRHIGRRATYGLAFTEPCFFRFRCLNFSFNVMRLFVYLCMICSTSYYCGEYESGGAAPQRTARRRDDAGRGTAGRSSAASGQQDADMHRIVRLSDHLTISANAAAADEPSVYVSAAFE